MINSFKSFLIEEEKSVFFTYGRMNPPTIGHEKLLTKLSNKSGKDPYRVYLTQSVDKKKNPLNFMEKVKYSRKMFPRHARQIVADKKVKTIFDAVTRLYNEGYRTINMVVGSDRLNEFDILLNKYNGKKAKHGFYNFEKINILSAGERDPDADGAEGMSASKMRQAVMEKDFTSFSQGLPKNMSNPDAKKLYNSVRTGMGLKEQKEFKNHVSLKPVSETREAYVSGNLYNIGDKVLIKKTNTTAEIKHLGSNYVIVKESNTIGQKRVWIDDIDIIRKEFVERMNRIKDFKSFGEQLKRVTHTDVARNRVKREKEFAKRKHDRIMDRARTRDTNIKNRMTR